VTLLLTLKNRNYWPKSTGAKGYVCPGTFKSTGANNPLPLWVRRLWPTICFCERWNPPCLLSISPIVIFIQTMSLFEKFDLPRFIVFQVLHFPVFKNLFNPSNSVPPIQHTYCLAGGHWNMRAIITQNYRIADLPRKARWLQSTVQFCASRRSRCLSICCIHLASWTMLNQHMIICVSFCLITT